MNYQKNLQVKLLKLQLVRKCARYLNYKKSYLNNTKLLHLLTVDITSDITVDSTTKDIKL